ncbi:MAG TPA: hypothetical protein VF688_04835 [Allosphingosinicella sp.]|jgi:hypothetical protein
MPRRTAISSILIAGTALLLISEASAQGMRAPPPTYEQTLAAISACGVPAAKVRITYEEETQSDLVAISDLGGSDEARFRCLREAVHHHYVLDVHSAPQRDSYYASAAREYRREERARALVWLKAKGKLGAVPHYDPGKGPERFARALEAACSIREGSVIDVSPRSGLFFRRSFVEQLHLDTSDRIDCLIHMIAASNAGRHGLHLTVIGGEASQTETRK